ncbi:MAG: LON peptidase substrate-binding domain-containing protein [Cypionkella sp.]|nr:LON peptidase substrate-binding domain-containing protein [Cypionkella sp.]
MTKPHELPETIALFPLPGALLLPRAKLPLHLFEPRYLAMLEDSLKTPQRIIGMVQTRTLPKGGQTLSTIGCAGRVTSFSETDDGRYMITLSGISRFRIVEEVQGFTPYRRAKVDWSPFARDLGGDEHDASFDRPKFLALLQRFFAAHSLGGDWSGIRDAETELLINSLSQLLPFSPEDKQALLEAPSLQTRRETMVALMEFAMHKGDSSDEVMQ